MGSGQPDYMNVTLLKGMDESGDLVTIAVDEDGNLIGVLKGDYEGTLKTLALDDQGRMLAVLTDPEDVFGNPHYMGAGELAVRNRSIVNFDRRGNVVWMDDFEASTLKWDSFLSGTGASVGLSTDTAKNESQCIKLVAGSDDDQMAALTKWMSLPPSTLLGFEISVSVDTAMSTFFGGFTVNTGTHTHDASIMLDIINGRLSYWNSGHAWTHLTETLEFRKDIHMFYTFKFVIDTATMTWKRVLFADEVYDLTGVPLYSDTYVSAKELCLTMIATGLGESNPYIYLDDFILTQNED